MPVSKTGYFSFNGSDLSAYVMGVAEDTVTVTAQNATVWGSGAVVKAPGLPENRVAVRFKFDPANVDAVLHPASQLGTTGAIAWRYDSGAIAAGNPEYQVTGFVASYRRNAGEIDGFQTCEAVFEFTTGVTRDITP